jgi:hypothetical protein
MELLLLRWDWDYLKLGFEVVSSARVFIIFISLSVFLGGRCSKGAEAFPVGRRLGSLGNNRVYLHSPHNILNNHKSTFLVPKP